MTTQTNPFAQSPDYWKVAFPLPSAAVATAELAFEDVALAVSCFEMEGVEEQWAFELLFGEPPDMAEVHRRLLVLCALHDMAMPEVKMEKLAQKDWLAQVARDFPPLTIGRFYVHGAHSTEKPPVGSIAIQIEAGAAFGSGEHGTTHCCLESLEWLNHKHEFSAILDMGCGSGILAIAAAKLWKTEVLAADIDAVAVRVSQENARINREEGNVACVVSDGYAHERIARGGPYDLIISNILARPLMQFAPDLARHLAADGVAVLSGLLNSQEAQVLAAHTAQGLKLYKRFSQGEWCTLVLRK